MNGQHAELALGTVQFGLAYGIAGASAAIDGKLARGILERAAMHGIRRLDTAPAYGDIEERLAGLTRGLDFDFVSKIPPVPEGLSGAAAEDFVIDSLQRSRARLGDALRGVLFHRAEDVSRPGAERMQEASARWGEANGISIGVSCYDADTLTATSRFWPVKMAQLPGNAFDQRLSSVAGSLAGIEITLRSIFLQGLLVMPRETAAKRLPAAVPAIDRWHEWCGKEGTSPLAGALALAKGLPNVRYCLVGVDNLEQLEDIATAWATTEARVDDRMAVTNPAVIDPRQWTIAA